LFLCYGLMIVTSAACAILMIYFVLCAENYHWQWRAFGASGASAGYVFAYSLLYWARMLSFSSWTGGMLYLGYSALLSFMWFVLSGKFAIWVTAVLLCFKLTSDQEPLASWLAGYSCTAFMARSRSIRSIYGC
jgi:hypothetical protein